MHSFHEHSFNPGSLTIVQYFILVRSVIKFFDRDYDLSLAKVWDKIKSKKTRTF